MNRDHIFLTVLITAAFGLSLHQMYYISLPLEQAAAVHWCQFSRSVDCLRSLAKHGAALEVLGVGAITALFAILGAQFLSCAFAWTTRDQARQVNFGAAKCLSFPSSGIAFFVLFHDITVADATSISTVGIAFFGLIVNVLVVLRGIGPIAARSTVLGQCGIAVAAVSCAVALDAAGDARRDAESALRTREAAAPNVHWPRFAHIMPRTRAARLGDPAATEEMLVFLDPDQEASRQFVVQLLAKRDNMRGRVIYLFARGAYGRQLVEAHARGALESYLATWTGKPAQEAWSKELVLAQERAMKALGIDQFPKVLTK